MSINSINLGDWLSSKGGLFVHFTNSTEQITMPNPLLMDSQLSLYYGERTMYEPLVDKNIDDVVELINFNFGDKWLSLANAELPTIDSGKLEVMTKNQTTTNDGSKTQETLNKVSGYNESDLIVDGGNNVNETDLNDSIISGSTTKNNYSFEDILLNLSFVQKTNIINVVLKDVVNYITHTIY